MRAICPLATEGAESVAARINITTTDPPAPMRWTVDDYHRAIDAGLFDDRRVELVGAEHFAFCGDHGCQISLSQRTPSYTWSR